MNQPKRSPAPPALHECPICHHPQTKIQRRLGGGTTGGSTVYVCARPHDCNLGIDLSKVDTWVAV